MASPAEILCIGRVLLKHIQYHGMPSWRNFATINSGYRRYIAHGLLFDLNGKDRDIIEFNNNIIDCSNLKWKKYMRSRNVPIKHHVTRHIIKSNDSIALVWEVAFKLHLLSPSGFNSTIVVKMSSYWSMTEDIGYCRHASCWERPAGVGEFLQAFFVAIVCIKHCRRFGEAVMKFTIYWTMSRQ